jgi:hypothetical protein
MLRCIGFLAPFFPNDSKDSEFFQFASLPHRSRPRRLQIRCYYQALPPFLLRCNTTYSAHGRFSVRANCSRAQTRDAPLRASASRRPRTALVFGSPRGLPRRARWDASKASFGLPRCSLLFAPASAGSAPHAWACLVYPHTSEIYSIRFETSSAILSQGCDPNSAQPGITSETPGRRFG